MYLVPDETKSLTSIMAGKTCSRPRRMCASDSKIKKRKVITCVLFMDPDAENMSSKKRLVAIGLSFIRGGMSNLMEKKVFDDVLLLSKKTAQARLRKWVGGECRSRSRLK